MEFARARGNSLLLSTPYPYLIVTSCITFDFIPSHPHFIDSRHFRRSLPRTRRPSASCRSSTSVGKTPQYPCSRLWDVLPSRRVCTSSSMPPQNLSPSTSIPSSLIHSHPYWLLFLMIPRNKIMIMVGGPADRTEPYAKYCAERLDALRLQFPANFWADPGAFFTNGALVCILSLPFLSVSSFLSCLSTKQIVNFCSGELWRGLWVDAVIVRAWGCRATRILCCWNTCHRLQNWYDCFSPTIHSSIFVCFQIYFISDIQLGGLKDTVHEYLADSRTGNGYTFEAHTRGDFL